MLEIEKCIRKYGTHNQIDRKTWCRNWRQKAYWNIYLDVDMYDVENDITKYCESNNIEFLIDGGWFFCISNRKQYNDIMKLIDSILYVEEEDLD